VGVKQNQSSYWRRASLAVAFVWLCLETSARAVPAAPVSEPQSADTAPDCPGERRFHADLELDPTAYALDGFSLHVGLGFRALRVDLGAFGLHVPEFVHGQKDFEQAFDGYGVKVQYFPFAEQRGAFIGVDGAYSRSSIHLRGSQLSARDRQFVLGINAGFRLDLPANFYVTPWLGVGYAFGAEDVTLAGQTFDTNPLILFPAIHLGYRLR
jgi:hypothetical protein